MDQTGAGSQGKIAAELMPQQTADLSAKHEAAYREGFGGVNPTRLEQVLLLGGQSAYVRAAQLPSFRPTGWLIQVNTIAGEEE
jgi:hypothetical protein